MAQTGQDGLEGETRRASRIAGDAKTAAARAAECSGQSVDLSPRDAPGIDSAVVCLVTRRLIHEPGTSEKFFRQSTWRLPLCAVATKKIHERPQTAV